jgi:hypothetical protein
MTNGHRKLFHAPRTTKIDTAARIDPPEQRQHDPREDAQRARAVHAGGGLLRAHLRRRADGLGPTSGEDLLLATT